MNTGICNILFLISYLCVILFNFFLFPEKSCISFHVFTQIIHRAGFQIQTSGHWMRLSFLSSESTLISLSWLSSLSIDRVITLLSSDLLFLLNFQAIGITADPSGKGVVFITKRPKCK